MRDIFGQGGSRLFGRTMGRGTDYSVSGFAAGVGCQQSSMAMVPLWTPAEIPGAVWVDANNATLDGTAVAALIDKIGGAITAAQGSGAARPTLVEDVLNGEPVLQFDGNDYLSFGTVLGKPANWTIFTLGMFASLGAMTNMCGSGNSAGQSVTYWGSIGAGRTANDGKLEYNFGNGSAYAYGRSQNQVVTAGNWFLCCRRYVSGQSVVIDRINGTPQAVVKDAGTATSCEGTPYSFMIGKCGDYSAQYLTAGSRFKGFVAVPSAISDEDAQRLEGYYAHLCGLQSLLPSDHPYKSAPPTI